MARTRWERLGALGGGVFAVLVLVGSALPGTPPNLDDPASKILRFYEDNAKQVKAGSFLMALSTLFLLWWLASLWSALRRTDDGDRPALIAVGGTLVLVVFLLAAAAVNAMIAVEKRNLGPEVTAAFYTLQVFLGNGGMFGLAAMVGATSAVGLRSKLLPQWLAWSGSVLAAAWVVAGLGIAYTRDALVYLGFVVFVAWLVWMLAVSAVLYRLPDTTAAAADIGTGTDAAR